MAMDLMKSALFPIILGWFVASAAPPAGCDDLDRFRSDDHFVVLEGTIGDKAVKMQLLLSSGGEGRAGMSGSYHYVAVGDAIEVSGSATEGEGFDMEEYLGHGEWETTGTFRGTWNREFGDEPALLHLSGNWASADGKRTLPFVLDEVQGDGIAPVEFHNFSEKYERNGMQRSQALRLLQLTGKGAAIEVVNRRLRMMAMEWQAPMSNQESPAAARAEDPGLKGIALAVRAELPTDEERSDLDLSYSDSLTFDDVMEPCLNRRDLLSVTGRRYSYTGGAHGNSVAEHLTFDLRAGRVMELDELLKPGWKEAVTALAEASLRRAYGLKPVDPLDGEGPLQVERLELNENWYLTPEGLGFCYDPYEISSYAAGFINPVIRYRDLKDWIRPGSPLERMLEP